MSLGNVWLGSMVVSELDASQMLSTNSANLTTPIQAAACVLDSVSVANVGAKGSDILQISISPVGGTAYCTVMYSATLTGVTSVFWQPTRPLFLVPGASVVAHVSNAGATGTINIAMVVLM